MCYTSRLYADEGAWAAPKVAVAARNGVPCWNPVLLKLPEVGGRVDNARHVIGCHLNSHNEGSQCL